MVKKGLSQEHLKLTACASMLCDHIGFAFFPNLLSLRLIGRLAFPIYCFLLTEGAAHTANPKKYLLRMVFGIFLAELPFDLFIYNRFSWQGQSVMVTLSLGLCMVLLMQKLPAYWQKCLVVFPFLVLGYLCKADYDYRGIMLIALFALTKELPYKNWVRLLGIGCIFWSNGAAFVPVLFVNVPWTAFAMLAMVPIALYSGRKGTRHPLAQTGFYLFYPLHLLLLWAIAVLYS